MRILILIHPDCLAVHSALVPIQAVRYLGQLESHCSKFDKTYSVLFSTLADEKEINPNATYLDLLESYYRFLESVTTTISPKAALWAAFQTAVEEALGDLVLDNKGLEIYIAGGYQNNCLEMGAQIINEVFGEIFEANKHTVSIYTPLVFRYRDSHKGGPGEEFYQKDAEWWLPNRVHHAPVVKDRSFWKGPTDRINQAMLFKRNEDYIGDYLQRVKQLNEKRKKRKASIRLLKAMSDKNHFDMK